MLDKISEDDYISLLEYRKVNPAYIIRKFKVNASKAKEMWLHILRLRHHKFKQEARRILEEE